MSEKLESLTPRELEFLRYVYLGYSREQIEDILELDEDSMEDFCKVIDFKMQNLKKEDFEANPFLMKLVA